MNKAVFLDRDGTLIEDRHFLADPSGVVLLPGVPRALRELRDAGYLLIVASNQSGIARGLFTHEDVTRVHRRLEALLALEGARLDALYYCPHGPESDSETRKPAPGMLLLAAREHGIDLAASACVGDQPRDVEAGERAGCGINILLAHDTQEGGTCAPDLAAAAAMILHRAAP
ncbi:MAG: HAD family hydrolase [Candidatus Hydrogenedentes bacterium]|nr:HAD family hydrolase [Candidatus Hydrogenedentota bacterium]